MTFVLKSISSDMSIATPDVLSCPLAWNIFSQPLTFNLYVSFALKWVSYRQQTEGFCIFIQSATLGPIKDHFIPLTFKVIIDRYLFLAILNLISQLTLHFCFLLFLGWLVSNYFILEYYFFSFWKCLIFSFDLWLPCFLNMLTSSYICLL